MRTPSGLSWASNSNLSWGNIARGSGGAAGGKSLALRNRNASNIFGTSLPRLQSGIERGDTNKPLHEAVLGAAGISCCFSQTASDETWISAKVFLQWAHIVLYNFTPALRDWCLFL